MNSHSISPVSIIFCTLILFSCTLLSPVEAAVLVAAENLPPGPMRSGGGSGGVGGVFGNGDYPGVFFDSFIVQTFLAEESGFLASISLVVQNHSQSASGVPLVVSLVSILGEAVTPSESIGDIMATAFVAYEDIERSSVAAPPYSREYNTVASYDATLLLTAGVKYGIRIGTPEGSGAHLRIWKPSNHDYADGERLENEIGGIENRPDDDIFFKVTVAPVPEPRVLGLLAMGCAAACFLRNWRGVPVQ